MEGAAVLTAVLLCTSLFVTGASCWQQNEICLLPPEKGGCRARVPQWYYNSNTSRCEVFVYGGCRGNRNRFTTEDKCMDACADICTLPPEKGSCRARVPQWYYNSNTSKCEEFVYGGCRGNKNRFATEDKCLNECADVCTLPLANGNCRAKVPAWFYNQTSDRCEEFVYGGCRGNKNRFPTENDCQQACSPGTCVSEDTCSLSPDSGSCLARIPLWYYNPSTRSCQLFTYGGCGGNDNRFNTESDCLQACAKSSTPCEVQDSFEVVGEQSVHQDYRQVEWFLFGCQTKCQSKCLEDHTWGPCMAFSTQQRWYGCNCYLFSRHISQSESDPKTQGLSKNRSCQ